MFKLSVLLLCHSKSHSIFTIKYCCQYSIKVQIKPTTWVTLHHSLYEVSISLTTCLTKSSILYLCYNWMYWNKSYYELQYYYTTWQQRNVQITLWQSVSGDLWNIFFKSVFVNVGIRSYPFLYKHETKLT